MITHVGASFLGNPWQLLVASSAVASLPRTKRLPATYLSALHVETLANKDLEAQLGCALLVELCSFNQKHWCNRLSSIFASPDAWQ